MAGGRTASAAFELVEEAAPRRERIRRMLVALGLGALTAGASHTNPGGQRLRIVDRTTGAVVATWTERAGDDTRMLLRDIRADLQALSADDFAARWVRGADPSSPGPLAG